MIAAGYDFNLREILDKKDFPAEKTQQTYEREEITPGYKRIFWGTGPAIRIVYDFNFWNTEDKTMFFSLSGIAKIHNYSSRLFCARQDYIMHSESAKQKVIGLCLYHGALFDSRWYVSKVYWGFGVRKRFCSITWAGYNDFKEEKFEDAENIIVPTIDAGWIVLIKTHRR